MSHLAVIAWVNPFDAAGGNGVDIGCRQQSVPRYPLVFADEPDATGPCVQQDHGAFEGGLIAPGINLSLQALHEAAAKLPRIAIQKPEHVIGTGTVEAGAWGIPR